MGSHPLPTKETPTSPLPSFSPHLCGTPREERGAKILQNPETWHDDELYIGLSIYVSDIEMFLNKRP
jgi:hypothetical protein